MKLKFELRDAKHQVKLAEFAIKMTDLEKAMDESYLGLGTPYDPIRIDNFVNLGSYDFPNIPGDTHISLSLEQDTQSEAIEIGKLKLICCRVKNVDKKYINTSKDVPWKKWDNIFDCHHDHIQKAPDGTLYISPDENEVCYITTKSKAPDITVAYSIIFSFLAHPEKSKSRSYYLILDPVIRVNSGAGSGTPK